MNEKIQEAYRQWKAKRMQADQAEKEKSEKEIASRESPGKPRVLAGFDGSALAWMFREQV